MHLLSAHGGGNVVSPVPGKFELISVVIPAYNEEEAIGRDLDVIHKAMGKHGVPYEIIVVNDGSSDRTGEIASEKGATVISHVLTQGSGAARKTGLRHARGEIVIMTDADGSYPNQEMPTLLKFFPEYDQVIGARKTEKGRFRPLRWMAKWVIRQLASYLTRVKIPDLNSGFRAFKRDLMMRYLHLMPDGFSCVTSITMTFLGNGHKVTFVPIDYYKRVGRSKFHPIIDTYNYLLTVVRLVMYHDPLRIFMPLGLLLTILGIAKACYDFFATSTLQESDILLLLSAVIIVAMGLLADLVVHSMRRR